MNVLKYIVGIVVASAIMVSTAQAEQQCFTAAQTEEILIEGGKSNSVDIDLVHTKTEKDGSFIQFYWKRTETVLAVVFDTKGCAVTAVEISLADFRAMTGIVLSSA